MATENVQPLVDAVKNQENNKNLALDETEFRSSAEKIGLTKDSIEGLVQAMQAKIKQLRSYDEKGYKTVLNSVDNLFGEHIERSLREYRQQLAKNTKSMDGIQSASYQESAPSQAQEETPKSKEESRGLFGFTTEDIAKKIFPKKTLENIEKYNKASRDPERDPNKNT